MPHIQLIVDSKSVYDSNIQNLPEKAYGIDPSKLQ